MCQKTVYLGQYSSKKVKKQFPGFSQKGRTPGFHETRIVRLEIYIEKMAKLLFLCIFEKGNFFKAKRASYCHQE